MLRFVVGGGRGRNFEIMLSFNEKIIYNDMVEINWREKEWFGNFFDWEEGRVL